VQEELNGFRKIGKRVGWKKITGEIEGLIPGDRALFDYITLETGN